MPHLRRSDCLEEDGKREAHAMRGYPITIVPNAKSKFKALDKYGKLIPCDKVDAPIELSETAWEPHWGNCNKPDDHRRR